jgi:hypothetical protein
MVIQEMLNRNRNRNHMLLDVLSVSIGSLECVLGGLAIAALRFLYTRTIPARTVSTNAVLIALEIRMFFIVPPTSLLSLTFPFSDLKKLNLLLTQMLSGVYKKD